MTNVAVEICVSGNDHTGMCCEDVFTPVQAKYITKFKTVSIPVEKFVNGILPVEEYTSEVSDREEFCCSAHKKGGCPPLHRQRPYRLYRTMRVRLATEADDAEFKLNETLKTQKEAERVLKAEFDSKIENLKSQISSKVSTFFNSAPVGGYSLSLNLGITGPTGSLIQEDFQVE